MCWRTTTKYGNISHEEIKKSLNSENDFSQSYTLKTEGSSSSDLEVCVTTDGVRIGKLDFLAT